MSAFEAAADSDRVAHRALPARAGVTALLASVLMLMPILTGSLCAEPQRRTLQHQGVAREVIVVNAPPPKAEPRPLMLVLHGRRQPDEANRSSPQLDQLAAREGFVVAYPAAIAGVWNYPGRKGGEIPLAMAGKVAADDVGFLERVIDRLIAERIADRRRIYVSGASMGGLMTYALMCQRRPRMAAAAAMIANMTDQQMASCRPRRAVPLLMIAGMADQVMPYYGREGNGIRLTSIPETKEFWMKRHRCTGDDGTFLSTPKQALDAGGVSTMRIDANGCRIAGALRLYRVDGGGHTLPSKRPQSAEDRQRFGPRSTELETSEEVWGFFKPFKLP